MNQTEKHKIRTQKMGTAFQKVGLFLIAVSFQMILTEAVSVAAPIGSVMVVRKNVKVTHPGEKGVLLVRRGDGVQFMDLYETKKGARAKLLFEDDSLLTLGGDSKLQITENIFNPAEDVRSTTLKLLSGRVRVLIGKPFSGTGSKFEVHTATAVAAARGTYYIVWVFELNGKMQTGVLAMEGLVDVHNWNIPSSQVVRLKPNQFTIVSSDQPPTPEQFMDPAAAKAVIEATAADEESQSTEELPSDVIIPAEDLIARILPEATFEYVPTAKPTLPPLSPTPSTSPPAPVSVAGSIQLSVAEGKGVGAPPVTQVEMDVNFPTTQIDVEANFQ